MCMPLVGEPYDIDGIQRAWKIVHIEDPWHGPFYITNPMAHGWSEYVVLPDSYQGKSTGGYHVFCTEKDARVCGFGIDPLHEKLIEVEVKGKAWDFKWGDSKGMIVTQWRPAPKEEP